MLTVSRVEEKKKRGKPPHERLRSQWSSFVCSVHKLNAFLAFEALKRVNLEFQEGFLSRGVWYLAPE